MEKLFEAYFNNEEVRSLLTEHHIDAWSVVPIITGKSKEPSFCVRTGTRELFVKFSEYNRFDFEFLSALEALNHKIGNRIILPFVTKNISSLGKQINIYSWIQGGNLRTFLASASPADYFRYGELCGILMRDIHQPLKQQQIQFDIVERFETYFSRIRAQGFLFEQKFDYEQFFFDNSSYLQSTEAVSFIHLDFKPKNIMPNKGTPVIVDIDSSSIGDSWLDFYDKAFALQANKETYNRTLITAYFGGAVPDRFWGYFRILSVFSLIQNVAWLIWRNQRQYLRLLETYLWDNYKGFTEIVPMWYSN